MNTQYLRTGCPLSSRLNETFALPRAPCVLLIIAVLLVYANVYNNDFIYDDLSLITGNKFLASWHYIGTLFITHIMQGSGVADPFYRPLQTLLYFFIYQVTGPSTVAFHLLNVVLHALNACLLYTLGSKLKFQRIPAFLATLLWAVHPVHTEAVTYMSGTADPLCGAFLLGAILALTQDFSPRCILTACVFYFLALLSKETAVVFPVLAMGLIFYRSENRWSPKSYLKTWPFWLMTALYFLARENASGFNNLLGYYKTKATSDVNLLERFNTFLATLPVYIQLLIWPVKLHMERSFPIYYLVGGGSDYSRFSLPPQVMTGLLITTTCFVGIIWKPLRRATPLAWGLLWAATVHFPQSGIPFLNDALIYEHWLYLPTMGLFLGIGESLAQWTAGSRQLRFASAGLISLVICFFSVVTFEQNRIWRDPVTFYNHIFDCGENSFKARTMLGNAYAEKEQYDRAIDQYRRALAISEDSAETHYDLGAVLLSSDDSDQAIAEAIHHFERTLEISPDYYMADDALAFVYLNLGDDEKAEKYKAASAVIRKKLSIE